jgi:hypothetical protein
MAKLENRGHVIGILPSRDETTLFALLSLAICRCLIPPSSASLHEGTTIVMTFPLAYNLDSAPSYHEIAGYLPKAATAQGSLSVPPARKARERVPTSLTKRTLIVSELYIVSSWFSYTFFSVQAQPTTELRALSSFKFIFLPRCHRYFLDLPPLGHVLTGASKGPELNPKHPTGGEGLINPWAGVITRPCTFIVPFHPPAPPIQALQLTHPRAQAPVVEFGAVISGPATFSVPLRPLAPPSYRSQSPPTPYGDSFAQPWLESATEPISNQPLACDSVQLPSPPMYKDYYYPLNDESSSTSEVVSDTDADESLVKQSHMDRLPTMQELQEEGYPEVWKSDDGIQLVPIDLAHFDVRVALIFYCGRFWLTFFSVCVVYRNFACPSLTDRFLRWSLLKLKLKKILKVILSIEDIKGEGM